MSVHKLRNCSVAALFALVLLPTSLPAAIVQVGNVEPNISLWNSFTDGYIGRTGNGSVLVDSSSILASYLAYLGRDSGSTGIARVAGAGSKWTNSSSLAVGYDGNGLLTIEDGGEISSTNGVLGRNYGSTGTVTVTGAGSKWSNSGSLAAGHTGSGSLTIEAGGLVSNITGHIGYISGSSGTATVRGAGSVWTNSGTLYVGESGNGSLKIEAGGQVSNTTGFLGYRYSTGSATVTGVGSRWTNSDLLYVGYEGNGSLTIDAGGQATSRSGYLGNSIGRTGTAVVTGANSSWTNTSSLYVGSSGSGTLSIEAGGHVNNNTGFVGYGNDSVSLATVTGADSMWTNSGALYIGMRGSGTLNVEAGGHVSNTLGYLGYWPDSNGTAIVKGPNSKWTNTSTLYVGQDGNGSLTIEAGGQVTSNYYGNLGRNAGSTGTVTVTGAGSRWTSSSGLYVGRDGSGNLTVTDGGEVVTGDFYASLSDLSGNGTITATQGAVLDADLLFNASHGDQATLTFGSGGTLMFSTVGNVLGVGYKGSGTLAVTEGANISSNYGYVGYYADSTGTATVKGANSVWSNNYPLYVGESGNGALIVEAGGQVSSLWGYLGRNSGSTGVATITGEGSRWTNRASLSIGRGGSGALTIVSGGLVTGGAELTIDDALKGDSFVNIATGGMLAVGGDADDSLTQFLDLVAGTDAIRYWDATLAEWSPLTAATFGTDYSLEYLTTGDLAGYTLLTVGRVGDFDNDGDVDGRDFLAWQRNPHLGSLADWQNAYGGNSQAPLRLPPSALNVAVPEPSCLTMLLGLMLLSGRVRAEES